MVKRIYNKKKLDRSQYVNIETAETLDSEVSFTSVNVPTDFVTVDSQEYIIIDSKAKAYVETLFNQAECGRIFKMTDMVHGCFNILYNKDVPHTTKTLAESLEYSRNKMTLFLRKLLKASIIYYIKGYRNDKPATFIMLNPTLARKSKKFHTDCISVFEDLSRR